MERAGRTLQDRLVKELRLAGVNDVQAGNAFLPAFKERFNDRFSVRAARSEDLHRKLNVAPNRFKDILCHREQRYVSAQLTISYDRKQVILECNEVTEELAGKYVELYDLPTDPSSCAGRASLFPIASSAKISV